MDVVTSTASTGCSLCGLLGEYHLEITVRCLILHHEALFLLSCVEHVSHHLVDRKLKAIEVLWLGKAPLWFDLGLLVLIDCEARS